MPQPAATVVLLRPGEDGPEVLLIRRPSTMAFGPDLHVFPGGKVDPEDGDGSAAARSTRTAGEAAAALGGNVPPAVALALHIAAIRELDEEAGVRLAIEDAAGRGGAEVEGDRSAGGRPATDRLATDRLVPIAHWTTPAFMDRRFSTWFFVADLPSGSRPVFAADEVDEHAWIRPIDALEAVAAGAIRMWVPTTSVLQRLIETGATSAAEVASRLSVGPAAPPRIVHDAPAEVRFAFGAAGGLPGRVCQTALIGRRELVLVDPGDATEEAVDLLLRTAAARGAGIRAIVLTATDPDHAAGAEAIAIPLGVPVLVAPGAGRHLPYTTVEVADGERLACDVELRVRLDGPTAGRLTLARSGDAG